MTQGSFAVQRADLGAGSSLVDAAHALLGRARDTDGVEAFSEGFTKELGRDSDHAYWAVLIDGAVHALAACAPDGSAELAVEPSSRRNGYGTALAEAVLDAQPSAGLWAHGDLPAAQALAEHLGLHPTRELLVMAVDGTPLQRIGGFGAAGEALPAGFEELSYTESASRWGRDAVEQAWLDVNNDAFSWHPEQGGWSLDSLHDGMDAPWFDPEGVRFLWAGSVDSVGETGAADGGAVNGVDAVDEGGAADAAGAKELPLLAGFHWTKRHSDEVGEVYVVGLSSQYRGRGLGDPLMRAGLEHLVSGGSRRVILYVEADNVPAVRRYEAMGFEVAERHVVYSAGPVDQTNAAQVA